jgi:hypothetical protein
VQLAALTPEDPDEASNRHSHPVALDVDRLRRLYLFADARSDHHPVGGTLGRSVRRAQRPGGVGGGAQRRSDGRAIGRTVGGTLGRSVRRAIGGPVRFVAASSKGPVERIRPGLRISG